jgi:hypothetical protein
MIFSGTTINILLESKRSSLAKATCQEEQIME